MFSGIDRQTHQGVKEYPENLAAPAGCGAKGGSVKDKAHGRGAKARRSVGALMC